MPIGEAVADRDNPPAPRRVDEEKPRASRRHRPKGALWRTIAMSVALHSALAVLCFSREKAVRRARLFFVPIMINLQTQARLKW
ncbi:MAG: hypothetical protein KC503_47055, partial [Myxococcales bacterium]|nr:hypothetical protein [Myxococcales bacterium]